MNDPTGSVMGTLASPEAAPAVGVTLVILGLVVGSFLNVVIARVPEQRSLWRPGSTCPACGAAIAWHDNIPLLSFLMLRGRCRACRAPISWRYPIVEAVTALAFVTAWQVFAATVDFLVAAGLLAALIAITVIDLDRQIIPDVISLPGVLAGFLANLATGRVSWGESLAGIALGGGLFIAIAVAGSCIAGQDAMGGGDVKFAAMLGAFLGWKVLLFTLFAAAVGGGILAAVLMALGVRGRKDPLPFGPFLAAAGATGLLYGERVVQWYGSAFGGS